MFLRKFWQTITRERRRPKTGKIRVHEGVYSYYHRKCHPCGEVVPLMARYCPTCGSNDILTHTGHPRQ